MGRLDLIDNYNSNRLKLSLNLVKLKTFNFSRTFRLHIQSVKGGHINRVPHETLGKGFGSCLSDFISFLCFRHFGLLQLRLSAPDHPRPTL